MLTVGGIVESTDGVTKLDETGVLTGDCFNGENEPVEISVPPLTVREKLWLDQNVSEELRLADLAFELDEQFFDHYKRYYRYYPVYHEALL